MPPSVASVRRTALVALILLIGKVMPSCSRCVEKRLVCVAIAAPSGCQPSSYAEYTKANMRSSYNVCSVSDAECTRLATRLNLLVPCLIYRRVSDLIRR